jgi:hypothetical protein
MKLGQPIDLKDRPLIVSKSGDNSKLVDAILRLVKAVTGQKPPVVNVAPPTIQFPKDEPDPTEWEFTHHYDAKGNLVKTIAKAKKHGS